MLTLVRAVLGLFGFLTGWFASYWFYFVRFDLADRPFLGRGAPFLVGVVAAVVVLVATRWPDHGVSSTSGSPGALRYCVPVTPAGWMHSPVDSQNRA